MNNELIKDDLYFIKYMDDGYQCKIETKKSIISVTYKGKNLITDSLRPYEVWYPTEDSPFSYQTADDIFNYIKSL